MSVPLEVPIVDDKQSAHLRITDADGSGLHGGEGRPCSREREGSRNTVVLPARGRRGAAIRTIGLSNGRAFVSLINLNNDNQYVVKIRFGGR